MEKIASRLSLVRWEWGRLQEAIDTSLTEKDRNTHWDPGKILGWLANTTLIPPKKEELFSAVLENPLAERELVALARVMANAQSGIHDKEDVLAWIDAIKSNRTAKDAFIEERAIQLVRAALMTLRAGSKGSATENMLVQINHLREGEMPFSKTTEELISRARIARSELLGSQFRARLLGTRFLFPSQNVFSLLFKQAYGDLLKSKRTLELEENIVISVMLKDAANQTRHFIVRCIYREVDSIKMLRLIYLNEVAFGGFNDGFGNRHLPNSPLFVLTQSNFGSLLFDEVLFDDMRDRAIEVRLLKEGKEITEEPIHLDLTKEENKTLTYEGFLCRRFLKCEHLRLAWDSWRAECHVEVSDRWGLQRFPQIKIVKGEGFFTKGRPNGT